MVEDEPARSAPARHLGDIEYQDAVDLGL